MLNIIKNNNTTPENERWYGSTLPEIIFWSAIGILLAKQWSINVVNTLFVFCHLYFSFKIEAIIFIFCCFILIFGWNHISMFFERGKFFFSKAWIIYLMISFLIKDTLAQNDPGLDFVMKLLSQDLLNHVAALECWYSPEKALRNFFTFDEYTHLLRLWVIGCATFVIAVIPNKYMHKKFTWDAGLLVLLLTAFLTLMVTSNNLFTFYVLLEGTNLALIALIAWRRYNIWALEAALKYFVLNGLINGLLLYSLLLFYYQTNSLNLIDIKQYLTYTSGYNWAVILFVMAFFFKLSAWPFHIWTPDVYEGAPTWVLFYMAVVIKSVLFGLFIRFLFYAFFPILAVIKPLFYAVGLVSIIIGTLGALWQKSLKRFLAYSTIVNSGLCIITLIAYNSISFLNIGIIFFHLFFYFITTFLTFALYLQLTQVDEKRLYFFSDYFSVPLQNNFKINCLIILFLTAIVMMAALPPAITFYSKFMLLYCLMQQNYYITTTVILVVNCVMCYYYLRIIKIFYFEDPRTEIYKTILFAAPQTSNKSTVESLTPSNSEAGLWFLVAVTFLFQWILTAFVGDLIEFFIYYATCSFTLL